VKSKYLAVLAEWGKVTYFSDDFAAEILQQQQGKDKFEKARRLVAQVYKGKCNEINKGVLEHVTDVDESVRISQPVDCGVQSCIVFVAKHVLRTAANSGAHATGAS
jgi:hypothetical protein